MIVFPLSGSWPCCSALSSSTDHPFAFTINDKPTYSYPPAGVNSAMSPMMEESPASPQEPFLLLQHGYKDMVGATAFNSYGDRFASSSVDGKIKVYNRHRDGSWVLCDTWTAHAAEILEVLSPQFMLFLIAVSNWRHRSNGSPQPSTPTS